MIRVYDRTYRLFQGMSLEQVHALYPSGEVLPETTNETRTGILITTGAHTLVKLSYTDPIFAEHAHARLTARYPGLCVELYATTSSEFINAQVDMPGLIEAL